jgi:hypothetical protein
VLTRLSVAVEHRTSLKFPLSDLRTINEWRDGGVIAEFSVTIGNEEFKETEGIHLQIYNILL